MNPPLAVVTFSVLVPMVFVTNWFRKCARDTYRYVRIRIASVNCFRQARRAGISGVQRSRREE